MPQKYVTHQCPLTRSPHTDLFIYRRGDKSGLVTLAFDILTLKVVSQSRVTCATSLPILVFLGLSVLDLGPMYATDRRQTASSLNNPAH